MSIESRVQETVEFVLAVHHHFDSIDIHAPLTGDPLRIEDFELVYIVMELMERFGISFEASDFENYKFNTISGIIDTVKRHLDE